MTEKYEHYSTVPKTVVHDCRSILTGNFRDALGKLFPPNFNNPHTLVTNSPHTEDCSEDPVFQSIWAV